MSPAYFTDDHIPSRHLFPLFTLSFSRYLASSWTAQAAAPRERDRLADYPVD